MSELSSKILRQLLWSTLAICLIASTQILARLDLEDKNISDKINNLMLPIDYFGESEKEAQIVKASTPTNTIKAITIIFYIAADNDLRNFAIKNIKQIARIGSTEDLNLAIHLDIKLSENQKVTRRYYIEKDRILHVNASDERSQRMDSGVPETLISCCEWAISNFPAKKYGLILWNHGTGIICPELGRIIKTTDLFVFNPVTNKIDLDRSVGLLDLINLSQSGQRGICWDESTGNYLHNKDLDLALNTVCTKFLNQQKFAFIGFDACLMQMIEIANIIKKYANIMIGSQEVILGTGWNYRDTLKPLLNSTMSIEEFAKHTVSIFHQTYNQITNDFTLSAINLDVIDELEANVNDVAKLLLYGIAKEKKGSVKKMITASRNRQFCTHFDEPSFIDLHHLYKNMLINLKYCQLKTKSEEEVFKATLRELLNNGCEIIEKTIIANVSGKNLKYAKGISIYFPTNRIHPSYRKTTFAAQNDWIMLLTQYLN